MALVGACTAPSGTAHPPVPTTSDGSVLLFSEADTGEPVTNFLITGAVGMPDGGVAMAYDVAYPEAGDRGGVGARRLAVLEKDRSLTGVALPDVDGRSAGPGALPLAASSVGMSTCGTRPTAG